LSQWETNLTQEQIQRFEWNEEDIAALQAQVGALEGRVTALEQAGGVSDQSQEASWEAPEEGETSTEGTGAGTGKRGSKKGDQ
jgi:hypothetical protein